MNNEPKRRVAMTLLAHPDDAEILRRHAHPARRRRLGNSHRDRRKRRLRFRNARRTEIAAIRRQEGINAAAKIGATYHCLDEPDVHVAFDKPTISKAIDLLRQVAPTLLFTHPRHDYMLDHEQVHLLARAAAFSYAIPNASQLPLIDGSAIPWLYYCDPVEGRDPYSGNSVIPTTCIDITPQIDRKIEMLGCDASYRDWFRPSRDG